MPGWYRFLAHYAPSRDGPTRILDGHGTGLDQTTLLDHFDDVARGSRELVREEMEGVNVNGWKDSVQWMGALALTVVGWGWTVMNGWHPFPVALVGQQGDAHPLAYR